MPDIILYPETVVQLLLQQFFGPASLVVFAWVLITAAVAWIELSKKALRAKDLARHLFDLLHDDYSRKSGKVQSTLALACVWVVFYGLASFVTQIWAGSSFSPGQGGGIAELLAWSTLFGALAVFGALILLPSDYDGALIFAALFIGYIVGIAYAIVWFTAGGGPKPGDWWVAPASSCCLILVAASYGRIRRLG